ncbi:MAG: hypothetical protein JO015_13310 [Verrucomicrobia bacterium]|nr:hypothetical protein [Verrucomicrobiota bacterium]
MSTSKNKKSSPERPETGFNADNSDPALAHEASSNPEGAELAPVPVAVETVSSKELLIQAIAIDTLVERVNLIKEAMKRCMVEGQHHGTIPGTRKPSLWKPGAELICTLFQLGTRYPKQSMLIERENGHFLFTLTCELFHIPTGRVVGEGVGAASTMEYRFRVQTEDRYTDHGQPIKAKYTPYDFYNTVLKIAKKRAMVDAVLTASGASEIFTQDTEDNPELFRETELDHGRQALARPARASSAPATPASQTPPPVRAPQTQTVTGVVERAWPNDYQGKRYYFAKVNGQQLQTTDQNLGEELLHATGQEIRAVVEPSPKPGKFYVKSFDYAEEKGTENQVERELITDEVVA